MKKPSKVEIVAPKEAWCLVNSKGEITGAATTSPTNFEGWRRAGFAIVRYVCPPDEVELIAMAMYWERGGSLDRWGAVESQTKECRGDAEVFLGVLRALRGTR